MSIWECRWFIFFLGLFVKKCLKIYKMSRDEKFKKMFGKKKVLLEKWSSKSLWWKIVMESQKSLDQEMHLNNGSFTFIPDNFMKLKINSFVCRVIKIIT